MSFVKAGMGMEGHVHRTMHILDVIILAFVGPQNAPKSFAAGT